MANGKRKLSRPGLQEAVGTGKTKRPLAPRNVTVLAIDDTDERKELANRHKEAGWHMFYGDRAKHKDYLLDGYEPIMEEGQAVHHKGDPLYRIRDEVFKARREKSALQSVAILEQARAGKRAGDTIVDSTGQTHRVEVETTLE